LQAPWRGSCARCTASIPTTGRVPADATSTAAALWDVTLANTWQRPPVWVHGDIDLGNLLVRNGRLSAVIDFGQLGVGDPARDLSMAWTVFGAASRAGFRATMALDDDTWTRGRGWTLCKAMIVAAGLARTRAIEYADPWRVIEVVLRER